jgi:hypothetical protein
MIRLRIARLALAIMLMLSVSAMPVPADAQREDDGRDGRAIRSVLLMSIDGMHALDFANCSRGIAGVNGGAPYCPHLAQLGETGVSYTSASSSRPSDSFPGLLAMITGGSPRSTGVYYDASYDRALSPPAQAGASLCPGVKGTFVDYAETADVDLTRLDAGGGLDPKRLPRDPARGCAPVYPHSFLKVNTIFEVIRAAGGYTAWADKHPSYDIVNGPSGKGVIDLYTPEINSLVVALPGVPGCDPVRDPTATDAWTSSFQNIQCYDTLKMQAVLNEIDGKTHDGKTPAPVPNVFGMNFQAVSVGQKLVEKTLGKTGGYLDALGTPSAALLGEIQFVDGAIGQMVAELKKRGLFESTLIIVSAKHGQSPIDPQRRMRIPADNPADASPGEILGSLAAQATEDDISLLWLTDQSQTPGAISTLEANATTAAIGEIFGGRALSLMFNDPLTDTRTPDIIVMPNVGVIYTGGKKKISEHGGFAHDDTNVMLLVANPRLARATVPGPVETTQIAPTIVHVLGLDAASLQAVGTEGTQLLPGLNSR